MKNIDLKQLRGEYPQGTRIELIKMEGESNMYLGLKGEVTHVDDMGQIHMKWENGSSLALNTEVDSFHKIDSPEKISVLLIEPNKYPKMVEIEDSLEAMQKLVGGNIEEYMPFEDEVAIVCNEEGKMNGMPLNRAIYSEDKEMLDIIAGKFFICSAPIESEKFLSLPEDLAKKYEKMFKYPEIFYKTLDGEIKAKPYKPKSKAQAR